MLQLKNAPDFTKVKVHAPTYKGRGGIEPSEARAQKQDQAAQVYAKVGPSGLAKDQWVLVSSHVCMVQLASKVCLQN